ncbi:MAG: efflux RND transporter periplasmic adaptor subunit [Flavobacteriaceae bacterium]
MRIFLHRALAIALPLAAALAPAAAGAAEYVVQPMTVPIMKSVFGQVQSRNVVPARARIGGTVTGITVEEGDTVEAGQTVAEVSDEKLALQRAALDAKRLAVVARLDNARTSLSRAQDLFTRGSVPKARLDEAQTAHDVLVNELQAVEAEIAVNRQQASEGAVVAPESGRVLTVPVTHGSVVLPGETILRVASGGYFLRLSLPERHAATIREGDSVEVGIRGADSALTMAEGRLVKVYPEIQNGRVIADVDVADLGDFFVGERTLVSIPVGRQDIIAVPADAITTRHGIDYVSLAGSQPVLVSVVIGERFQADGTAMREVLSGLAAGDRVVTP